MTRDYEMDSTSRQSARLADVILRQTSDTRLVARPEIVHNEKLPEAGVKIILIHQRCSPGDKWEDIPADPLSKLKAGEGVRLHLDSATTLQLKVCLTDLYAISSSGGVRSGHTNLTVTEADKLIRVDKARAQIIKLLLTQQRGSEIWKALESAQPDLATALSYGRVAAERARVSGEFHHRLKVGGFTEPDWQNFFEKNKWIFGYGLKYVFLKQIAAQPQYGGADIQGRGGQKGDYLATTEGQLKFTVLVEIKRPDTELLKPRMYRSGAWPASDELAGAIAQVQANCRKWESEGSRSEANVEALQGQSIFTAQPKGILVIGQLGQLDGNAKRTSFELLRRSISNPEIITFDELYQRAKFISEHGS
jgi:Domain of unknown function (DUF4263)